MSTILVVSDNESMMRQMVSLFFPKGYLIVSAHSQQQDLAMMQRVTIDLTILNLTIDLQNAIDISRRLRENPVFIPSPILFLTDSAGLPGELDAFSPDVDDYLKEPFEAREVEFRALALLRRREMTSFSGNASCLQVGRLTLDSRTFEARIGDNSVRLTPIEFTLLRYLMFYAGEVIPAERLLRDVWRYRSSVGHQELVRIHIKNLRHKLDFSISSPFEIVQTVPRHGYTIPTNAGC